MEVIRYKYIFVTIVVILFEVKCEAIRNNTTSKENSTTKCPYTKIIEDIFKIHNKTSNNGIYLKDTERTKLFLNTIANVTTNENNFNNSNQERLVNNIIASINRIKSNITNETSTDETHLDEAIILNVPNSNLSAIKSELNKNNNKVENIKSGIEKKTDSLRIKDKLEDISLEPNYGKDEIDKNLTTEKTTYVEILTIEPNNTSTHNTTSHNIIEVLKHLMPMFNKTMTNKLHNITIIEKNYSKNHTYSTVQNVSTIIVNYCDKENLTKANVTFDSKETDLKVGNDSIEIEDFGIGGSRDPVEDIMNDDADVHLTVGEKKDILEAAQYGVRKMHELYSVLEPKLYSMGLWLDDTNPARYVAAFNAPTEDLSKYSRYGYATLQAATKLKELTSGNTEGLEGRADDVQFPTASALRQSPLLQHCPLRGIPKCPPASKRYRTHDGTCNNFNRPRWGSTLTPVQRFLTPSYSDGLQTPRKSVFGSQLPSAREISTLVHENQNIENPGITHLLMQWGQFLDHDVTSTSQSRGFNGSVPRCCKDGGRDIMPSELMHPECFPIPVPSSDPFYGPRGVRCLDFVRSSPAPRDDCALGWREQINQVSAYIDGSPLYASSARQSDKLRLFRNGMLQYGRVQQRRPLLPPERKDELCRGGAVSTDCFKSGDARVNEHPGLVAAHIVWLRQHNRMAQELAHLNPHWSDEKIYQETRKIIGAMIQHITYKEFLPVVLGSDVMRLFDLEPQNKGYFRGYDPKVNPSPASSFGSAAFRFGHSLVQSSMMRYDRFHRPMNNNVSLHDELTNPSNIWSMGAVDRLLLGMVNQPIQKRDEFITEELTNHLFQTPQFDFGMDLAAINIQRGRDHGIPPYTSWREPCGLSGIQEFSDLSKVMPLRAIRKFQSLYRHVDDIDLFTGGMAERPVIGGLVGPTFACIIAQQFSNLRKGDRFWYENGGFDSSFTPAQLQQIRRISFSQILCHTLDSIESIQPFAFLSSDQANNNRIPCRERLLNDFELSAWIEINSDFNNDISKTDDDTTKKPTDKPKRTKPTTTVRPTTTIRPTTKKHTKTTTTSNKIHKKKPAVTTTNKKHNKTESIETPDSDHSSDILTLTVPNIDDKLDFKNKSRRYENSHTDKYDTKNDNNSANKQYNEYNDNDDDEDDVQSVQSVVINNFPFKRPYDNNNKPFNNNNRPYQNNKPHNYNRPVMTVTENIDKFTYLINYVPRPTESWRQTTRKNSDRNVVKVTYQTYDDTYRRPNRPYYNRHDNRQNEHENDKYYRHDIPDDDLLNLESSARSNDVLTSKPIVEKLDYHKTVTQNPYKLVTFGYVGTYKGDMTLTNDRSTKPNFNDNSNLDMISKDFSTYDNTELQDDKNMKLTTFYSYETVTQPYIQRPTKRQDDYFDTKTKYYFVKNVLHKYPDDDLTLINDGNTESLKHITESSKPSKENVEERAAIEKLAFLEEMDKSANQNKFRLKIKKPASPAKTPSVAFQVIPSENAPSQWAVYDEKEDSSEMLQKMPEIKADPYALKEIPRPMMLDKLRRHRPNGF